MERPRANLADPFLNLAAPPLAERQLTSGKNLGRLAPRRVSSVTRKRRRSADRTSEYRVEHPRWKIWPAVSYELRVDIVSLYGEKFVDPLTTPPASAFIADGSFVTVYRRGDVGGAWD